MRIDNFDVWLGTTKAVLQQRHTKMDSRNIEDVLKECWDNAFQAGKEDRDEEVRELKDQISELEKDNNELEMRVSSLGDEIEDLQND